MPPRPRFHPSQSDRCGNRDLSGPSVRVDRHAQRDNAFTARGFRLRRVSGFRAVTCHRIGHRLKSKNEPYKKQQPMSLDRGIRFCLLCARFRLLRVNQFTHELLRAGDLGRGQSLIFLMQHFFRVSEAVVRSQLQPRDSLYIIAVRMIRMLQ